MTAQVSSSEMIALAQIIHDLHAAGSDNDWTMDDLLEILRREDPDLYRQTLQQMTEGQPKSLRLVA